MERACRCTEPLGTRTRSASVPCKRRTYLMRQRREERIVKTRSAIGFVMGGYAVGAQGGGAISQLASTLGVLIGAAWFASKVSGAAVDHEEGPNPECSTCEGSGRVPCMCTRWSDGDVGCGTCRGTGRMACPSCGGSGTGVPIPLAIKVRPGEGSRR